jgi:hypothetical protein
MAEIFRHNSGQNQAEIRWEEGGDFNNPLNINALYSILPGDHKIVLT